MHISVAICTWNRAELLGQTLTQMRSLQVPPDVEWELLIVNNNCTDGTDEVIARHSKHLPIRRLFEPKLGQSNARNCAVAAAAGDFVLWTDDDVLVEPTWLAEYVAAAKAWPAASFFGGTIDPWFAVKPQRWILRHMQRLSSWWAVRQLGEEVRPLEPGEFPFGASLGFRTDVLRRYRFDPTLGRMGNGLMGGEEIDVMEKMVAAGEFGVWVGTAHVRHYIPAGRLTLRYVWRFHYAQAQWMFRTSHLDDSSATRLLGAPRWLVRKYVESIGRSLLYSAGGREAWLNAFLETAYLKAMIDDFRKRTAKQTEAQPMHSNG